MYLVFKNLEGSIVVVLVYFEFVTDFLHDKCLSQYNLKSRIVLSWYSSSLILGEGTVAEHYPFMKVRFW